MDCVRIKGEAITDSQGHFVFEHVPPFGIVLFEDRKIPSWSGITLLPRIWVKPGETTNVEIKTQGRTVVGRLKLAPELAAADINIEPGNGWFVADVDWHGKLKWPEMPTEFDTPEKRMKWWFDLYESDWGKEWLKAVRRQRKVGQSVVER